MSEPKRQRGGKRPGAGRPAGSTNALEYGEARAVKALRLRVPEATPEPVAAVADEAFETVVRMMRGEEFDASMAAVKLRAAAMVREEICGPVKQRVEVNFSEMTDEQLQARFSKLTATSATKPPEGAGE